jgi:hypothetical protein
MCASVRGSERFAEHVQHPGLPFSIKILHVIVPFNSTTTHISPKCLIEQNVQLVLKRDNKRESILFISLRKLISHSVLVHYS